MWVLSLDTTTRAGSVALASDGRVIEETAGSATQPPAARLPGDLMAILSRHGLAVQDIDLYAVATGPGSFTGLRIGIATMQGVAFATRKPLIGVSGLDALARVAAQVARRDEAGASHIATWVDAWRGEAYAALYEVLDSARSGAPRRAVDESLNEARDEATREVLPPTVDTPAALLAAVRSLSVTRPSCSTLFIGDGAESYRDLITSTLGTAAAFPASLTPALAGAIAILAWHAARGGLRPPPHAIRPLYVRRPDAELARSRARGLAAPTR